MLAAFFSFRPYTSSCLALSHDPQFSEPLQNLLVYGTQPLLLESLFSTHDLNYLLQMLPYEHDEIDLMHGVSVDEFALAYVFRGFWFRGVVGLWRPIKRTVRS
jgi:hypothetical protein